MKTLRDYQEKAVQNTLEAFDENRSALIVLPTGCHEKGTPILKYNGSIVPVEDVRIGDLLMGHDGGKRTVVALARGHGRMLRIAPIKGEPWVVNEDHILTLVRTRERARPVYPCEMRDGEIVDVRVKDYLGWSNNQKHLHKLFRVPVDFPSGYNEEDSREEAYFVALMIGDGHIKGRLMITTPDEEVVSAANEYLLMRGLVLHALYPAGKATTYDMRNLNGLRYGHRKLKDWFGSLGLLGKLSGEKFVPRRYLTGTREVRLAILAGLIDTDGHAALGHYDYVSKSKMLADDAVFLARSVGLSAYAKSCKKQCCNTGVWGTYYRVSISGDLSMVPCRVKRKRMPARKQKKDVLRTGFSVEEVGYDDYYGFSLREDPHYLLGDFTVTHNTGKTFTASHIAKSFLPHGRVMWLSHRAELIYQAAESLADVTGKKVDVEMAGDFAKQGWLAAPIICSTVQTQISGRKERRMERFDPSEFSLLVHDESHHSPSVSHKKTIEYYQQNPNLKVLGLTATPDRADEKALGQIFDTVSFDYDVRSAINDGWLTPVSQQSVYVESLDFSEVRTVAGDLNSSQLAEIMEYERNLHEIAQPTIEITGDMKTLIFTVSVAQAERMAEILNRYKPSSAQVVTGTTPKDFRRQLFSSFGDGEFQYLVNVGVVTEGVDVPDIECVVLARPTKSRSLFAQMIGRGLRPLPGIVDGIPTPDERRAIIESSGKPYCQILDFVGNAGRHKLIHPADILGGDYDDEVIELAQKMVEKEGKPADVASMLEQAEREIARRHKMAAEAAARAKLRARAKYSTATINPFNVLDITPAHERAWHKGRLPTGKQIAALEKFGVDADGLSFTHASQLLDRLIKRSQRKLCSFKQARLLQRFGYATDELGFSEASRLIDQLAKNNWRRK